jgi:hypothetical protein
VRLVIAVPALDHSPTPWSFDLARLYAVTCAAVPCITLAGEVGTFVHQAREKLLHDVVELWGATHVLWLDTDMAFPADAALRLLAHDVDIVAANYVKRAGKHQPTAMRDGQPVYSLDQHGLAAVDHVGMGVFLMKASVVVGLPHPRFWYSTPTETEDVYFCRLLHAAGHTIHVDHDLSQDVGHIGQETYRMTAAPVPAVATP